MSKFKLQTVVGSQRKYANPDDINHVIMANQSMSRTKQGTETFDYVRGNTTVQKRYDVKLCADKCAARLNASARVDFSLPAALTKEQAGDFLTSVLGPVVAATLMRVQNNGLRGFIVDLDISTGPVNITVN